MKKSLYFLFGITVFLITLSFTNISNVEASGASDEDLVEVDTSVVPASYELEVFVNKNDSNREDLTVFVDNHIYRVVDGKLVESFEPIFMPMATDSQNITLKNNGRWTAKEKYVGAGTTVHTGSTGPEELREHQIRDYSGKVLSSVSANSRMIGCQKTVTSNGYYSFLIRNLSATTQTWNWTVTF